MVVLGLGSNVGDRLANLREALHQLKQNAAIHVKRVSPLYLSDALLPPDAPSSWKQPFLNLAIKIDSTLSPMALLQQIKAIERSLGRNENTERWGPRVLDIDILAWDTLVLQNTDLTIPHQSLLERPFALWPLADVAPLWVHPGRGSMTAAQRVEEWGSRFTGQAPFRTRQIYQRIDVPQLVGIVNVTPDSFSDGGQFLHVDEALQQIAHLVASGADIIDIGAESTSPTACPITQEQEWSRLAPLLSALKEAKRDYLITPKISIDTHHAAVAEKALTFGVDWINDVCGLDDPAMREIVAQAKVDCVVMHHLSIPERRDHVLPRDQDPVKLVYAFAEKRLHELEQQGISREKIIFDPGIGFGKMAEQSLLLLQNAAVFHQLGVRLLIGHSRKTFLSLLSAFPFAERDIETLAIALTLAKQDIHYLRVHNVEHCARGLRVMRAL